MSGWVALVVQAVLAVALAPTLDGFLRQVGARLRNEAAPPWQQSWRDLGRLWRKPGLMPSGAWFVFAAAPAVAMGAAGAAVLLTPGFTAGLGTAGGAELVVVAGLLTLSRVVPALAAYDAGALASYGAREVVGARVSTEPVLMLGILAAALVAGGNGLGAAPVREGFAALLPGALAGLALLGWAGHDGSVHDGTAIFSGRDLALVTAAGQLRRVTALSLAAAVGLPFGMASAGAGVEGWVVGVCCWVLKMGGLGVIVGVVERPGMGPHRIVLQGAALLAMIAAVIVGVQGRA